MSSEIVIFSSMHLPSSSTHPWSLSCCREALMHAGPVSPSMAVPKYNRLIHASGAAALQLPLLTLNLTLRHNKRRTAST